MIPIAMITLMSDGPRMAMIASASRMVGKDRMMSKRRGQGGYGTNHHEALGAPTFGGTRAD